MAKARSNSAVRLKLVPRPKQVPGPKLVADNVVRVECANDRELNPKIARFFAEQRPETPCLVVDLDAVAHSYQMLRSHLPLAKVFYAVKANPAPEIVSRLCGLGANFDVASRADIELCFAQGATSERMS